MDDELHYLLKESFLTIHFGAVVISLLESSDGNSTLVEIQPH